MLESPPYYNVGEWWPAWSTLLAPFLAWLLILVRWFNDHIHWPAAFVTVAVFELVVFPAEIFSVQRGHWVYNDARILGYRLFHVPIEEPFLYYFFGPLVVIATMTAIRVAVRAKENR